MRVFRSSICALLIMAMVVMLAACAGEPVLKEIYLRPVQTQSQETGTMSVEPQDPEPSDPTGTVTEPSSGVPVEPSKPVLREPIGEGYIGHYTLSELEALDDNNNGYGPGMDLDEKGRPYGAMQLNEQYGKYDAWFVGPDDGMIYLTFDLGWENEGLTHQFLDILKEKDVKAVFFVLKEYCDANPDIIRRIIDEGHMLASHAYHHKVLADLSVEKIVDEIWDLHTFIREEYGYEMTLFRPPSGEFSEQVLAVAHGLGYRTVNWSYAYVDWLADDQPEEAASLKKLMDHAHSGCIYLLHTVSTTNAALLDDLIDGLRAEGYEFGLFTQQTS